MALTFAKPRNTKPDRKRATRKARKACLRIVKERDRVCQLETFIATYEQEHERFDYLPINTRCFGALEGHVPAHHRNVDFTLPENNVLACTYHNGLAEDAVGEERELLLAIGWIVEGNGFDYVKRRQQ